jgi:hypothetical protein
METISVALTRAEALKAVLSMRYEGTTTMLQCAASSSVRPGFWRTELLLSAAGRTALDLFRRDGK